MMDRVQARHLPHRVAFFVVAFLVLSILALLPFALTDVVEEAIQPGNPAYSLTSGPHVEAENHSHVNLQITNLDEWQRTVTITVSGHHICDTTCSWTDHLLFVSIPPAGENAEGLPPFAAVDFRPTVLEVSQQITLPVHGDPIRYPFDSYRMRLGIIMQRVYADGTTQTLSPEDAQGHLFITVNGFIPRAIMGKPVAILPSSVPAAAPAYQYMDVSQLTFARPLYLEILTIFLVVLVSAAAAYAVFLRPLNELVINAGALVLGVWGIRAILLGPNVPGFTVVDLSLMVVILFLLLAISWRSLVYLHERSELRLPLFPQPTQPRETRRESASASAGDHQRA